MGEIGLPLDQYRYDLTFCDLVLIERGYARRHRHLWSATRWGAYQMLRGQVGDNKLRESGIFGPQCLMRFPWEKPRIEVSKGDIDKILAEMEAVKKARQKRSGN